jgi:uncharacterized protein (DUF488 family)
VRIFTIGFTRTSAQGFFGRLSDAGARRLIDVRLNNVSQLAGFAKRDDLRYFADRLCGMGYEHRTDLAPTKDMLAEYRQVRGSWPAYAARFVQLLAMRRVETLPRDAFDRACLVCSEASPHRCHRRLVAEYLSGRWDQVEIVHL